MKVAYLVQLISSISALRLIAGQVLYSGQFEELQGKHDYGSGSLLKTYNSLIYHEGLPHVGETSHLTLQHESRFLAFGNSSTQVHNFSTLTLRHSIFEQQNGSHVEVFNFSSLLIDRSRAKVDLDGELILSGFGAQFQVIQAHFYLGPHSYFYVTNHAAVELSPRQVYQASVALHAASHILAEFDQFSSTVVTSQVRLSRASRLYVGPSSRLSVLENGILSMLNNSQVLLSKDSEFTVRFNARVIVAPYVTLSLQHMSVQFNMGICVIADDVHLYQQPDHSGLCTGMLRFPRDRVPGVVCGSSVLDVLTSLSSYFTDAPDVMDVIESALHADQKRPDIEFSAFEVLEEEVGSAESVAPSRDVMHLLIASLACFLIFLVP